MVGCTIAQRRPTEAAVLRRALTKLFISKKTDDDK
jgi:hypothetical protein